MTSFLSKMLKKKKKKHLLPPPPKKKKKKVQDPPMTPSRQIITTNNNGQVIEDDDISAVTPATAFPDSPTKTSSSRKQFTTTDTTSPSGEKHAISLLLAGKDDDSSSHDFMIFEDKVDEHSSSLGSNLHNTKVPPPSSFSGGEKLKVSFSDEAYKNNMMIMNGTIPMEDVSSTTAVTAAVEKKSTVTTLLKKRSSILTESTYFTKIVNSAFETVDVDKSGDVTVDELYSGLLLIHLQMASFIGAPACKPASKKYVKEVFNIVDTDNSGTLDRDEFGTVMKILYSQVFTRIIIQWGLTLMIVPMTTNYIMQYATFILVALGDFLKDIGVGLDPIQELLSKAWEMFTYHSPAAVVEMLILAWFFLSKIPWKSIPPVILTLTQTSIALPWLLNNVENFFRRAAHYLVSDDVISKKEV